MTQKTTMTKKQRTEGYIQELEELQEKYGVVDGFVIDAEGEVQPTVFAMEDWLDPREVN